MAIEDRVKAILEDTLRERLYVYFSSENVDITFETRILAIQPKHLVIANRISPEYITASVNSRRFYLQCQMLRFESEAIGSDGENILFPVGAKSLISDTRQSERFPFSKEERVLCEFVNPFDQETYVRKRVIDMSATGLSLRTSHDSKLFASQTIIPNLKVLIDGKQYTRANGKIVYKRKLIDYRGMMKLQVGLQFL